MRKQKDTQELVAPRSTPTITCFPSGKWSLRGISGATAAVALNMAAIVREEKRRYSERLLFRSNHFSDSEATGGQVFFVSVCPSVCLSMTHLLGNLFPSEILEICELSGTSLSVHRSRNEFAIAKSVKLVYRRKVNRSHKILNEGKAKRRLVGTVIKLEQRYSCSGNCVSSCDGVSATEGY